MNNGLDSKIQVLEDFNNSDFPILSVILSSSEKEGPVASVLISKLHSMVHQNLSKTELKLFRSDLKRIETYLRESYDRRGKRTLVFFSAGKKLWQTLDFEFYLPPLILISYSPYLGPVNEMLIKKSFLGRVHQ